MKILFIRHAESVDDLTNQFGGWGDFPLTYKGKTQIAEKLDSIEALNIGFETVLSSPLIRAHESGEIISNYFGIPHQTFHYLKEYNGNGLLSGLNRDEAGIMYPELTKLVGTGEYIFGAEPAEEFKNRVRKAVELISKMELESVVVVTHGGFMKILFEEFFDKKVIKTHDGGFALTEYKSESDFNILKIDSIDIE